jgi:hypothetical protein
VIVWRLQKALMGPVILSLAACSSVAVVGKRTGSEEDLHVDKMQVYSFVPMHVMGSERLRLDTRGLDEALTARLRGEKVDAIATDVEALVRRHGLPVDVSMIDREGSRRSMTLPVDELLAASQAEEVSTGVSHRLVLIPDRLLVDRSTGITHGVLRWRLEAIGGTSPLAFGLMRYTADVRGFPTKGMARQLVAELHRLGVH